MWFEVGMTERISYVGLDYYVVGLEGGTNWEISLEQWEVLIWIITRFIGQLFLFFMSLFDEAILTMKRIHA